jgi:hypothetical protein
MRVRSHIGRKGKTPYRRAIDQALKLRRRASGGVGGQFEIMICSTNFSSTDNSIGAMGDPVDLG